MSVIDPADVTDELAFGAEALGLSEADFDSLIQRLIDRETPRVEDAIDVSLGTETVTKTLSRPTHVDEHDLPLPAKPIQSVESVSIDTERVSGAAVALPEDVVVEETHLALAVRADRLSWPTKRRSITVEWTHGYPETDTPEPIRGALIGLVRHALQEVEADGISSESIDGHSVTYELGDDVVRRHLARAAQFDAPSYYGGTQVV